MNKKCYAMSLLAVLAVLPLAFAPVPSDRGSFEAAVAAADSQTVEVIPFNTTLRSALTRFSLFSNKTYYDSQLGRNIFWLGYRTAGEISGWKTAVYYFYGWLCTLNGDMSRLAYVVLDVHFGLPDYLPQFSYLPLPNLFHANTHLYYDDIEDRTSVSWELDAPTVPGGNPPYPEPDARVPISGSWIFIDLYLYNETPIDDMRIGLSLYLQR